MEIRWKRLLAMAPVVAILNMLLLFALFMNPVSQQIIFSESLGQSPKLVAVWTEIEPVPSLVSLTPALVITPLIYSFMFALLYDSIPGRNSIAKGFAFGVIVWALVAVFFELFTPNGLFGEPAHLLAFELMLWFVGLAVVGTVMGIMYHKKEKTVTQSA
jgi:hypothetical protein